MLGSEGRESGPETVGNAPPTPIVNPLRRKAEVGCDCTLPDPIDQGRMMMQAVHAAHHTRGVYGSQALSLMAARNGVCYLGVMGIAERMKLRRDELRLSGNELARRSSVSAQRMNNYLQGRRTPDPHTLGRIAAALETSTDHLLGISDGTLGSLETILYRLFELKGMEPTDASAMSEIAIEALRLSQGLQDEGDDRARSRMAAQAAWKTRTVQ